MNDSGLSSSVRKTDITRVMQYVDPWTTNEKPCFLLVVHGRSHHSWLTPLLESAFWSTTEGHVIGGKILRYYAIKYFFIKTVQGSIAFDRPRLF